MQDLSLRQATESDYDNVVLLMQQLNPDDPIIDRTIGLQTYRAILDNAGLILFIADVDDQPVATCYLNVIPNLTRGGQPYAVIENVVTNKAHRHKGIGIAMIKRAIAEAFEKGCYKVMLLTGRDKRVHTFYESCGMEKNTKTAFVIRK